MPQRRFSAPSKSLLSCFSYAVGHGKEGVCLLVRLGPYRILLDCGLPDITDLQTDGTSPADVVICSHAHGDHVRGLYALHQTFPTLPIYASEVTAQLLPLHWPDRQINADFCQPLPWRSSLPLFENLSLELIPAGHLPGASLILLTYQLPNRTYKVLYTGDFSLSNLQLVEGLSLENLRGLAPDVLILESSYGTRRHPHRRQQEKRLMEQINEALQRGRNVLLPVPPLGLGQEILKLLRSHHQFTGQDLDIWVGGSLQQACDRYLELLPQFPLAVQNFAKHQPLFWDERVCPRLRPLTFKQEQTATDKPYIVLTDQWETFLQSEDWQRGVWTVLLPEFPTEESLPDFNSLAAQPSPRVAIETYLLAEHSDGRNTTQFIHNVRPQHIVFVHGSAPDIGDLTALEELQNRYQLHSPSAGVLVDLPIGDRFLQPPSPTPTVYEGEVNELDSSSGELAPSITITLSDRLTEDPRWQTFANTGLIEGRWQGEELVLRGISQRELLKQHQESKPQEDLDCCSNCRYYRHQRCWNTLSPLAGFRVTPEGYCPVYESWESV